MQIRAAATLALIRDTDDGIEVLMLQRSHSAVFLPGFFVFAGGAVDEADQSVELSPHLRGHDDASASSLLAIPEQGIGYLVAALRESFEEAGILLAQDASGDWLDGQHPAVIDYRSAMVRGEKSMIDLCLEQRLTLPLDQLAYIDHWITPPGPPRRFDTRFFVAPAPPGQVAAEDGEETIDHCWLNPQTALADYQAGRRLFVAPTVRVLRRLLAFRSVEEVLADAGRNPPQPFPSEDWPAVKGDQRITVSPDQPAYSEVRKLDPKARGGARAEITPGQWVALSDTVSRLTAPNPSVMTGPGTNTYLIRDGDDCVLIDPGPDDPAHIERLLAATDGKLSRILVTHTHPDHSPGAARLKAETGATLIGMPPPGDGLQDASFRPDHVPVDGERLRVGSLTLKTIHTPGHASNHLCYLLEGQHLLFSGDHIMQGSTVVINPPDGDMAAYLKSLNALLIEDIAWIGPGHGFLMGFPQMVIDNLVTHRLTRESKVMDAVREHGPGTIAQLTTHAYADAPKAIHGVAARSLLAHLLKLAQENRVVCDGDRWRWIA